MRGAGAAKRHEQDQDQPPDGAAAEADLMRVIAGSEAVQRRLGRHERAIEAEIGRMQQLAAQCPDAERLAMAADKIAARYALVAVELISDAAHMAEAREAAERLAAALGAQAMMREAWIAEGRRREAAERDALPRAPRPRHAARSRRFRVVGGIAAGAALAAPLAAGSAIADRDSASVHAWAASRPVVRLHAARPDSAVLVPQPRLSSAPYVARHAKKPSADAASASPVPSSVPSSAPAPQQPQPSLPAPVASPTDFDGTLDVQTAECVIGADGTGYLTLTAEGGAVSWSASPPAGITLSQSSGTLAAGQPAVIKVTAQPGLSAGTGSIVVTDGEGRSQSVQVTWVTVAGLAPAL